MRHGVLGDRRETGALLADSGKSCRKFVYTMTRGEDCTDGK